jgi:NADPH-dependent curcumin reductase CurA
VFSDPVDRDTLARNRRSTDRVRGRMNGRTLFLARRPHGMPVADDFRIVDHALPEPGAGEVLVRNTVMSIDPYMRGRMNDVPSYTPPFALDAPMEGRAVGEVAVSRAPELPVGANVMSDTMGFREAYVAPAGALRRIDVRVAPAAAYLGVLGMTGLTAWVGLHDIAALASGDVVFVSAATGAVGNVVVQLAKRVGARAIASVGSAAKAAYARDVLGADAAFDYHDGPTRTALEEHAPAGIDVYFDNVGGEQLDAALGAMRTNGRIVLCGAVAQYNATAAVPGPGNLVLAIGKRLTLRGFIVTDHLDRYRGFVDEVAPLVASGAIVNPESYVDGLDAIPAAFGTLLGSGERIGKALVRLAPQG